MSAVLVLLPLILLLGLAEEADGQRVRGRLIEDGSGEAIVGGAVVLLHESEERVLGRSLSNSLGFFILDTNEPGRYRLRAERIGYQTATTSAFELHSRQVLRVELTLSTRTIVLQPLEVVSEIRPSYAWGALAGYYDRKEYLGEKLGIGRFITRAQIERMQPYRMTDLLRRVPGLRVRQHPGQPGRFYVRSTSNGDCPPAVYLDGVPVGGNRSGVRARGTQFSPADELLSDMLPSDLEGVEVYRGSSEAPPEYSNNAGCGVILLWTRRG